MMGLCVYLYEFTWMAASRKLIIVTLSLHTLLPPASSRSKDLSNSDEDVDGIHVDAHAGIDGVEGSHAVAVGRMSLRLVDDLLSVVEHEGPEEDEATIHGHAVETSSHGCGGREEGGANAGAEHNT